MFGVLFLFLFGIIIVTAGLLFSILAYTRKVEAFFWIGAICTGFITIGVIWNIEHYFYEISVSQDPMSFMIIAAWLVSVIFLIMSKTNKKPADDNVTDAFLDEIINAEDEEWDPES